MNRIKINIKVLSIVFIAGLFIVQACKKEEIEYPRTRLFQPVLNEDLYAVGNTIVANLGNMKEAEYYTVEVSIDSFQTVDYTFQSDTNLILINEEAIGEELLWFFIYQVRVTGHADEEQYNSLPSDLGSVRTEKFPSNMGSPTYFDVLDTEARVFWTKVGDNITKVKVFDVDDYRLENPLAEHVVTLREQVDGEKFIDGLTGSTSYQIAIYSGETLRGWEVYNTREPFISGDNVYDLSDLPSPVNLFGVLPDIPDGSYVVLGGGKTYLIESYEFDKSLSFIAGYSYTPALPMIDCASSFGIYEGANVDSVTFKDIYLTSTAANPIGTNYVFNISQNGSIGEIRFKGCTIRKLRGITRFKDAAVGGVLEKFTISDCVVDSIGGYGVFNIDVATWEVNDILLENSTFSKCENLLVSKNNTNTVSVDGCTVSEVPKAGNYMFRWREAGQDNVNQLSITNTIWGHAWSTADDGKYGVTGYIGNINWNIVNTYTTSEFEYGVDKAEIPGFPNFDYNGMVTDLWTDPYNADFNFNDLGFAGKGDSGDPRWRIGL